MNKNSFINFLEAYGPSAIANNMYDEFVVETSKNLGIDPIKIDEDISKSLFENISNSSKSIILTGTAGDGKTYTARMLLEKINQESDQKRHWSNNESVFTVQLHNKKITFLKDMSELSEEKRFELVSQINKSFCDPNSNHVYVICANDGLLLKSWRNQIETISQDILEDLQNMLKDDLEYSNKYSFRLINLSRRSNIDVFDRIIDKICGHTAWSKCNDCELFKNNNCAIIKNKSQLEKSESYSIRNKLKDLLSIAATNDQHMPIRQLMILIVNILLGYDKKNTDSSKKQLLDCKKAHEYKESNIINNIFGDNLKSRKMKYTIFSTISDFLIGFETNKFFEDQVWGEKHIVDDTDIIEKKPDAIFVDKNANFVNKRRHLFFESDYEKNEKSIWNLTAYKHADLFLKLLIENNDKKEIDKIKKIIVKSLNRIFSQSLTRTNSSLWLMECVAINNNINYLNLRVGNKIELETINSLSIKLESPSFKGRPPCLKIMYEDKNIAQLNINPSLFEYILQINNGVLLNGVYNHKLQEIKNFQIKCLGAIESLYKQKDMNLSYVSVYVNDEADLTETKLFYENEDE